MADYIRTHPYADTDTDAGADADAAGVLPGGLRMYPRNPHGTNNTVSHSTVGRSGDACIVTSQLSNEISYCRVFGAGMIGRDDAGKYILTSRMTYDACGYNRPF